jgi:hypothetical protein
MGHDKETETEQRIRERAFQIWIEEGQPEGRDKIHWQCAEQELRGQDSPPLQPEPISEIKLAAARTIDEGGKNE